MMFGATPYASSAYGALAVPSQVSVTGAQSVFATGAVQARAAQRLSVAGAQSVFATGAITAKGAASAVFVGAQSVFATGAITAKGAASAVFVGTQSVFATGAVQARAAQRLSVTGAQAALLMGVARAQTRQRIEVSGVQARFYTNGALVWYDIPMPAPNEWADVFQVVITTRAPVGYSTGPYSFGAYSGDAPETLTYEIADDAWREVTTSQPDSWRDIVL